MSPESHAKNKKIIASFVVIVVVVLVAFGASMLSKKDATDNSTATESATSNNNANESSSASNYKDGTYTAAGSYITPGGQEDIDLTVTIKNGVITESSIKSTPNNDETIEYQDMFKENYIPLVVGKKVDDVKLSRVSGSSLTATGFHNALDKIKDQAKS